MGVQYDHAPGEHQEFFCQPQVAQGTMVRATAAGAFNALKLNTSYEQARIDRNDNRPTAGLVSRISGMRKVAWDCEGYLIPSGTAGTAPDMQDLFQSVFGTEAVNGGTSVVYSLSSSQTLQLNSIHRVAYPGGSGATALMMESLIDAWVNECKITFSGSDPHKVSFSGGAARLVQTLRAQLNGAMVTSATMVVDTAQESFAEVDSIVTVGANTNTGTGYRVTADASPSFTLEATLSAADDAVVAPYAPTPTLAGEPIAGILGSFTFNGGAIAVTGGEVVINNGLKPIEDQAFAVEVPDVVRGRRSVTGSFNMRVRADQLHALGIRKNSNFTAIDCALVLGTAAGSICTIDMDRCELGFSAVEFPEEGEATVSVPFVCLEGSRTTDNAISLTFT